MWVVIFFFAGGGGERFTLKIHRTFLSTLNMGMSHRQRSEFFLFVWGGGCDLLFETNTVYIL